jgi:transposase InsO family protein
VIEKSKKSVRFQVIDDLKSEYSVKLLCKIMKVSVPGYYKWRKNVDVITPKKQSDNELKLIIKTEFDKVKGIYGYRRITMVLREQYGLTINHKRVRRLMKELGLLATIRTKKFRYNNPKHLMQGRVADNLINRDFTALKPCTRLTTDITYLKYNNNQNTMYLSVIKDLYNNEILSYKLSSNLELRFVLETLKEASKSFPSGSESIILHSDQGAHYTSKNYQRLADNLGVTVSMSRRGNCYDNASQESFFSHLKSELFYFDGVKTKEEVEILVKNYINFYNEERVQKN